MGNKNSSRLQKEFNELVEQAKNGGEYGMVVTVRRDKVNIESWKLYDGRVPGVDGPARAGN